jgi:enoyl-CoA hydratase/carnithine racemase
MSKTDSRVLLSDDSDGVRTLMLNRARRKNAINPELWIALRDALTAAGRDRAVRALVITGAGGSFCSGADIAEADELHPKHKLQRLTDVALALHELAIPTVAKVTGVAVGAGWNLALGCDLVAATPESTFSRIFYKRGCRSTSAVRGCCRNSLACNRPSGWRCWPKLSMPRKPTP